MECGGRAKRRHRFGSSTDMHSRHAITRHPVLWPSDALSSATQSEGMGEALGNLPIRGLSGDTCLRAARTGRSVGHSPRALRLCVSLSLPLRHLFAPDVFAITPLWQRDGREPLGGVFECPPILVRGKNVEQRTSNVDARRRCERRSPEVPRTCLCVPHADRCHQRPRMGRRARTWPVPSPLSLRGDRTLDSTIVSVSLDSVAQRARTG